ncbi:hypothetical protein OB905_13245 [Halobacteria archaeon AArc-dxtr1]|nr:hypothetical protein [Halobacteria archaeon AArc-dxtr1]
MKPTDDAILEYVRDAREVPPAVIGRNISSHPDYVGQRCRTLAKNDLLHRADDGYYSLAELGRRYLDEEISADELEIDED